MPIHFAFLEKATLKPLCGDFGHWPNWTMAPAAVTCSSCRERLRARAEAQGEPAAK